MGKGISLTQMSSYALVFVVVAVILGVTATILSQVQETQCLVGGSGTDPATGLCYANSTTTASNATAAGVTGISTLSQWVPIIAVIVAAAIVIGIIVTAFRG